MKNYGRINKGTVIIEDIPWSDIRWRWNL